MPVASYVESHLTKIRLRGASKMGFENGLRLPGLSCRKISYKNNELSVSSIVRIYQKTCY